MYNKIPNAVVNANQMLHTMPSSSGKYFMTALALASMNPKDAKIIFQSNVNQDMYTSTQYVMNNSLQDMSNGVNQIDKSHIKQYLSRPDVNNQLQNHTLLNDLSRTNLPNAYRRLLVRLPHLSSAQIVHKFYVDNIVKQERSHSLTPTQHQKYQDVLNQGVKLGTTLSPSGLNYLRQSLKIYRNHPALFYAINTKDTSEIDESATNPKNDPNANIPDYNAYQNIDNITQGIEQIGNNKLSVQPPVPNTDIMRVNQYVYRLPTQVIQSNDLSKLLTNISASNKSYAKNSQTTQFLKKYASMSPQLQQSYKYLIQQSRYGYNDTQAILHGQLDTPTKRSEYSYLETLLNNDSKLVTPQQKERLKQFFIDPTNKALLQDGSYNNVIYHYEYGDSSINGIVHKAMKGKRLTEKQERKQLDKISKQYKTLDRQSQVYMRTIAKEYAYNPQSFERQYIATMSNNPHMLSSLSHSEKVNEKHIQNIAQGKVMNNGKLINIGTTAQHKLDVDYMVSEPMNRNLFRSGAINRILNKDNEIRTLSATNQQQINNIANVVKEPHSTIGTLHRKNKIHYLETHVHSTTESQQSQQIQSHQPQQRHTKQR